MANVLSFIIALLRALVGGKKFWHSLLEACLGGTLTLATFPALDYFGLSIYLAVTIGAGITFWGVEFVRNVVADSLKKLVDRWIKNNIAFFTS